MSFSLVATAPAKPQTPASIALKELGSSVDATPRLCWAPSSFGSAARCCSISAGAAIRGVASTAGRWQQGRKYSGLVQAAVKWVLEPAGDGDSSHLDEVVPPPSEVQLDKDVVVIGRSPERVDVVLPVATVSGRHAQIENRSGEIFVTDLKSTNGTYVDDKQLRPDMATRVNADQILTFGDEHLAQFRLVEREE